MACVNACPDTAILAIALPESELEPPASAAFADGEPSRPRRHHHRCALRAHPEVRRGAGTPAASSRRPSGSSSTPSTARAAPSASTVCHALGYDALHMIDKVAARGGPSGERRSSASSATCASSDRLPPTPPDYRNEKALADLMLGEHALGYVGGAGSCSGCGEATAVRMLVAATRQVHGPESHGHRRGDRLQHRLRQHLPVQPVPRAVDQLALRERARRGARRSAPAGTRRATRTGACGSSAATGRCTTSASSRSRAWSPRAPTSRSSSSTRRSTRTPAARPRRPRSAARSPSCPPSARPSTGGRSGARSSAGSSWPTARSTSPRPRRPTSTTSTGR